MMVCGVPALTPGLNATSAKMGIQSAALSMASVSYPIQQAILTGAGEARRELIFLQVCRPRFPLYNYPSSGKRQQ